SQPAISATGRFVAFTSYASNLVRPDRNKFDVFLHDRKTGKTTMGSVSSTGEQGNRPSGFPQVSANGRFVAFSSPSFNLVPADTNHAPDVFVHDRKTAKTTRVSVTSTGEQGNDGTGRFVSISATGRFVAFTSYASNLVAGDTNGTGDVIVHDRR